MAYFINKLALAKVITKRVNPRFESIFAIGVDEMSWDDLDSQNYDWPPVAEVFAYRNEVRRIIEKVIDEMPKIKKIIKKMRVNNQANSNDGTGHESICSEKKIYYEDNSLNTTDNGICNDMESSIEELSSTNSKENISINCLCRLESTNEKYSFSLEIKLPSCENNTSLLKK